MPGLRVGTPVAPFTLASSWRSLVTVDRGSIRRRGKGRGGSLAQTDTIAAHFSLLFYSSVKGGSYPEISAQFHLYLVANGRDSFVLVYRSFGVKDSKREFNQSIDQSLSFQTP